MAKEVTHIELLKEYVDGVVVRADHHARWVNEIALALVGAIVWKKDQAPLKVFARDGEMKNVLWVNINGVKYAFSYSHEHRAIDMRQGTTRGKLIHSFSNSTPLADIRRVFEAL